MRQAILLLVFAAWMTGGCAHTTQSRQTSSPESEQAKPAEDDEFNPDKMGEPVPCEKNFDDETCASLRRVFTKGP